MRGPKSAQHIEAMKRGAKGRKRPILRTEEHAKKIKTGLAAWRNTPEFQQFWGRRRSALSEINLQKQEAAALAKEATEKELAEIRFKQLIHAIANGTAKVCARCKATKAPQEFSPNKKMKSGRQAYCKKCCAEYQILLRQRDARSVINIDLQLGLLDTEET